MANLYTVYLERTYVHSGSIIVRAESEEEAYALASVEIDNTVLKIKRICDIVPDYISVEDVADEKLQDTQETS